MDYFYLFFGSIISGIFLCHSRWLQIVEPSFLSAYVRIFMMQCWRKVRTRGTWLWTCLNLQVCFEVISVNAYFRHLCIFILVSFILVIWKLKGLWGIYCWYRDLRVLMTVFLMFTKRCNMQDRSVRRHLNVGWVLWWKR